MNSLVSQTFQDFELLAYHDGPLLDESAPLPVPFKCTEKRHNDWGHSLRDMGIHDAIGEYILTVNSDNILYPQALEEISRTIDRPPRVIRQDNGKPLDSHEIIIFAIIARGQIRVGQHMLRAQNRPDWIRLLTGNPPIVQSIDAMQFVMQRELWLAEGGWYDKTYVGDGLMYQKFAEKYGYRSTETVLGEHY